MSNDPELDLPSLEAAAKVVYRTLAPTQQLVSREPSLEFAGSFSVYPFFDSGTIVMSSMGEGLFILRPDVVPTQ